MLFGDGFFQWKLIWVNSDPEPGLRRRFAGGGRGGGPEEEEENAIESRVGEAVPDAKTEAPERSDGAAGPAAEGKQPRPHDHKRHDSTLPQRRGRELCSEGSNR